MDDHRSSDDGIFSVKGYFPIDIFQVRFTRLISYDITHVAIVPHFVGWSSMTFHSRIEMASCRTEVFCTAVAELMNVKTMPAGRETHDIDGYFYSFTDFLEENYSGDFTSLSGIEHTYCFGSGIRMAMMQVVPGKGMGEPSGEYNYNRYEQDFHFNLV
jgi:hypothetical protein